MNNNLKVVELDELELYLNQLQNDFKEELRNKTYLEIASLIELNFGVQCSEQQINLLYDPKLEDLIQDTEYFYGNVMGMMGLIDKEIYNN